jgi:hypothetical protein
MSPGGIWLYNRDESGLVTSVKIYVRPCANEADPEAREDNGNLRAWSHGCAEDVLDDGATLLCRPCATARHAEAARQRRLAALPPSARDYLAQRGITDWPTGGRHA